MKKLSNSKQGAKPSETSENVEIDTEVVEEEDKPSNGVKENGKQTSESELKTKEKRKFPSKPSNGIKANGKVSSEPESKRRKKRQFPSKEEISNARLNVFSLFYISLWANTS